MYVPILKWRQGEYLALDRLDPSVKEQVMPLIEVPPIEWDFERGVLAKTIDEHLEPFPRRLHIKWKKRPCFIDLNLLDQNCRMLDGSHPLEFTFDEIRKNGAYGLPVTGLSRDASYQKAVKAVVKNDSNGVCFRVLFQDIAKSNISTEIQALMILLEVDETEIDFVLDLESPNFDPIDQFIKALHVSLSKISQLSNFRTFTIVSTAFPKTMGELSRGSNFVGRSEWLLYQKFCSDKVLGSLSPQFGDYAIAHPSLPQQDMRLLKPSASLRYTVDDAWWIEKGTNVRDNGFEQYRDICKSIIGSKYFYGESYSAGDKHIKDCSEEKVSTGNLGVWRWVGTNHHITKVVDDLASFAVP